jgi:hypothetical protein
MRGRDVYWRIRCGSGERAAGTVGEDEGRRVFRGGASGVRVALYVVLDQF